MKRDVIGAVNTTAPMPAPQVTASDESLMAAYRDGDARAFESLYQRHKGPVYRYFRRQHPESLAEELHQETWIKLIKARQNYTATAKFTTYLYHIAQNTSIDHYRKEQRRPQTEEFDEQNDTLHDTNTASNPETGTDHAMLAKRLRQLIPGLPQEQRNTFLLKEEAGLSLEAISTITNTSKEATKSRWRYAIQRLREGLKSYV